MKSPGPKQRQGGFTLIETIMVVVLLGIMMAGMTVMFVENASQSHQPYLRQRALAVANAYMDEILRKRWDDNTPLGGGCVNSGSAFCPTGPAAAGIGTEEGSRSNYDDIDDYNGLSDSPPLDSLGNTMTGYAGFSVAVSVTNPLAPWNGIAAADVKRIKVDVTSTMQETISVSAYRVNF
jgi:MSHA pilin protein MshD